MISFPNFGWTSSSSQESPPCDFCDYRSSVAIWRNYYDPDEYVQTCLQCQWLYLPVNPATGWPFGVKRYFEEKTFLQACVSSTGGSDSDQVDSNLLFATRSDINPRFFKSEMKTECPNCSRRLPDHNDFPLVMKPCCGRWSCWDCAVAPRNGLGYVADCLMCGESLANPSKGSPYIEEGKCGHTFHRACIKSLKVCMVCYKPWKTDTISRVCSICYCGEKLPTTKEQLLFILVREATRNKSPHAQYMLGIHAFGRAPFTGASLFFRSGEGASFAPLLYEAAKQLHAPAICAMLGYAFKLSHETRTSLLKLLVMSNKKDHTPMGLHS